MITHIQGKLVEKTPTHVIIDCNGVGYFVNISLHTFSQIPDVEAVKVFIHFQVKEDSHTLYGFMSSSEREIFRLLISVSGIGANTARTMLSSLTPKQIREGIAVGDVPLIQSVKGIGLKTAQRVIIDLKDKIVKTYELSGDSMQSGNTIKEEALSALEVLGFSRKKIEKVIQVILQNSPEISLEELIKQALKNL